MMSFPSTPLTMLSADDPAEGITTDVEEFVPQEFEELISGAGPLIGILVGVGISALVALAATLVTSTVLKQFFRRRPTVKRRINRTRTPFFCILLFAGSALTVRYAVEDQWWDGPVYVGLLIAVIISVAWWALRVVKIVEAVILAKYIGEEQPGVEDRRGRRVQTQMDLIGRILAAIIITLAVAAVLLLNESVRGLGAGLLASAGVVSVVAGLAMQSTLANLFAGIQLAFTDSIRVGDVVVIEENFATVEEITLSTVVLKSWDGRRFIYPSAYFVSTPFENWTRVGTELLGAVELDVDWRVPMDALRGRLRRLLSTTDLWDGETSNLQVTDAVQGHVTVRVVVSARNSGELWDLRCLIREDLVNFLRAEHPYAVMTQRMLITKEEALGGRPESVPTGQLGVVPEDDDAGSPLTAATPSEATDAEGSVEEGLFTGSIDAVERNREFAGPGEDAYRERKDRQAE
ncbi:mechanosensitive ion channel family protein [Nesterenkonia alkaliphila]|uniref:Mechanosensitive ion channel n=1 Tax=Nesterenkonia alkaliphila TaxID=1463631 RepID=A0A7K1UKA0_9MICC|nr:mechanosensitive ion channel domain-containing protein [Nesterenkonia alkaliphila]MVT26918.1 mechanosensitive ion channel [Nesterenkonia alkaliphila]GFZ90730.1 mechanosensitive ion channel protein MscS [Nesterenkonia alkaliphila]